MVLRIVCIALLLVFVVACGSKQNKGTAIETLNYCNFSGDNTELSTVYEFASD